eukprot:s336_g20.t1
MESSNRWGRIPEVNEDALSLSTSGISPGTLTQHGGAFGCFSAASCGGLTGFPKSRTGHETAKDQRQRWFVLMG